MRIHAPLFLTLFVSCCLGAMKPTDFVCRRNVIAPEASSGELAAFRLDNEIYHTTKDEFSDLRLFDEQESEIAFVVRHVTANDTDTVQYSIPLTSESFQKPTEAGAAVVFRRSDNDSIPTHLYIATETRNFEKSVSVFGSNDRKHWVVLAESRPIFDYSQFIDIRTTTVEFSRGDFIFYKVTIDSVWGFKHSAFSTIITESNTKSRYTEFVQIQEPFRLDGVEFSGKAVRVSYGEPLHESLELAIDSITKDTTQKSSEIFLASNREPVSKLKLSVTEINFTRRATVYATNDSAENPHWEQLGSGEIFNITTGNYKREELEIPLSTTARFTRYRLSVMNGDNAPITVTTVLGKGPRHEILFFHREVKRLLLCYGAEKSETPRYDIETILKRAPVVAGTLWKLGKEDRNVVQRKPVPFVYPRYLLIGVLGLMVVILVIILGIAVRRIDAKSGGES